MHAVIGDKLAGDPGYVGDNSGFIELADGFGPEVQRTWEYYDGVWTPVVRDNSGRPLGVYNFGVGRF